MNKVQETMPNVIGGVSQQPPALRRPDQCSEQVNTVASTVEGMVKRPPFKLLSGTKFPSASAEPFVHKYRRGDRLYAVVIDSARVFVANLSDGTVEEAKVAADAAAYLRSGAQPLDAFDAITAQDTTFIANRGVVCAIKTTQSGATRPDGIVFWKGSGYGETFKLRIDRLDTNTYAEWSLRVNDPPAAPAQPPLDPLKTNKIAQCFANMLAGAAPGVAGVTAVSSPGSLASVLGLEHELDGSRIRIRGPAGSDFALLVEDGQGGNFIKQVKDRVEKVSDLPPVGFDGFLIRIAGNLVTIVDDYWVRWDGQVWVETVDPTCVDTPDAGTMPHILRPKEGGGWEFKRYQYSARACGDLVTNPSPSFVDSKITSLFFHRDRLGFLTTDSIVQSEVSSYGNFYRTTVTSTPAGDPIDVLTDEPFYAFPFDRNLAIFANSRQCMASAEGPWTAATMALTDVASFEMDQRVRPHLSGKSIFFASTNGGFSRIKRFVPLSDTAGGYDERDLCDHVPRYVPKDLRRMAVSEGERFMLCVERGAKKAARVYQWLEDSDGSLLQSSWHSWTIPMPLLDAVFDGAVLYALVRNGSSAEFASCDLTPNRSDEGLTHLVALDMRYDESGLTRVYDQATDRTVLTLPDTVADGLEYRVVCRAGSNTEGAVFPVQSASGKTVVVEGDATKEPIYVGAVYEERYTFSEFVMRDREGTKRPIERVNVGLIDLELVNTADLNVEIKAVGRPLRSISYASRVLGDARNILNRTVLRSGTMRVPVRAKSDRVEITLRSASHLPTRLTGATWRGSYSDRQTAP